jgi:hypothetical protein
LKFRDCLGIGDEGLIIFSEKGLCKLKKVYEINLDFSGCHISDIGLIKFLEKGIIPLAGNL